MLGEAHFVEPSIDFSKLLVDFVVIEPLHL